MKKSQKLIVLLIILISVVAIANYLFYSKLNDVKKTASKLIPERNGSVHDDIIFYSKNLLGTYSSAESSTENIIYTFAQNIRKYEGFRNATYLWKLSNSWVSKQHIVNHKHEDIGKVFAALKYTPIVRADLDGRGSQLKFFFTLQGDQKVVFKPKWYEKDKILKGPIYGGKDRHNSEIIAFYLSVILNLPFVPLSVERKISLKKDIIPIASKRFLETTFTLENRTCVYGKCSYCSKKDPICSDQHGSLTGAVIFNIKNKLKVLKSPWIRTYKTGKLAEWEHNQSYCMSIQSIIPRNFLLEIVDTAIFDFFIQNGDRHDYESLDGQILLLDNGKGFGNPYEHHIDILAPLYQCCMLRKKTWRKLMSLAGNKISQYLKLMPDVEEILMEDHLKAIDSRLLLVYGAIEYCKNKKKMLFV